MHVMGMSSLVASHLALVPELFGELPPWAETTSPLW